MFAEIKIYIIQLQLSLLSGNEKLSILTMNRRYKLRIELEDFVGEKRYAEYSVFSVNSGTDKYRLTVEGYAGNAGIQSYLMFNIVLSHWQSSYIQSYLIIFSNRIRFTKR